MLIGNIGIIATISNKSKRNKNYLMLSILKRKSPLFLPSWEKKFKHSNTMKSHKWFNPISITVNNIKYAFLLIKDTEEIFFSESEIHQKINPSNKKKTDSFLFKPTLILFRIYNILFWLILYYQLFICLNV